MGDRKMIRRGTVIIILLLSIIHIRTVTPKIYLIESEDNDGDITGGDYNGGGGGGTSHTKKSSSSSSWSRSCVNGVCTCESGDCPPEELKDGNGASKFSSSSSSSSSHSSSSSSKSSSSSSKSSSSSSDSSSNSSSSSDSS